jgi:flagellar biosynthesis/type III secretory pathway M-ring protein FliF/YscJ
VAAAVFVLAVAFFVWWQFIRPRRRRRSREAEVAKPKRGAMAIPRGRVRGSS